MVIRKKDNLYKNIEKRDLFLAFTLVYFVISFGITFYLNFLYLFNSKTYFIPKFFFVIIFSVILYLFMVRHFILLLGQADINEDLDAYNSTAYILSIGIFILNSLVIVLLLILFLYFGLSILGGVFSGNFYSIHHVI